MKWLNQRFSTGTRAWGGRVASSLLIPWVVMESATSAIAFSPGLISVRENPLPVTPTLLAQRFECRQVVPERGVPFYSALPLIDRPPSDYLSRGSRVSVDVTTNAVRGADGQFYQFVTYPFNSPNTVTGYIPVQVQTSSGLRTSLEACRRKIMW